LGGVGHVLVSTVLPFVLCLPKLYVLYFIILIFPYAHLVLYLTFPILYLLSLHSIVLHKKRGPFTYVMLTLLLLNSGPVLPI
jgi:hypothetical protein